LVPSKKRRQRAKMAQGVFKEIGMIALLPLCVFYLGYTIMKTAQLTVGCSIGEKTLWLVSIIIV